MCERGGKGRERETRPLDAHFWLEKSGGPRPTVSQSTRFWQRHLARRYALVLPNPSRVAAALYVASSGMRRRTFGHRISKKKSGFLSTRGWTRPMHVCWPILGLCFQFRTVSTAAVSIYSLKYCIPSFVKCNYLQRTAPLLSFARHPFASRPLSLYTYNVRQKAAIIFLLFSEQPLGTHNSTFYTGLPVLISWLYSNASWSLHPGIIR